MKLMFELYTLPLREMDTKGVVIKTTIEEVKENMKVVSERIGTAKKEIATHAQN